jgi:hypothetical protein
MWTMTEQRTSEQMAPLSEVIERFKAYVRAQHNASAWWNDAYAYKTMRWIEDFEQRVTGAPHPIRADH